MTEKEIRREIFTTRTIAQIRTGNRIPIYTKEEIKKLRKLKLKLLE